MATINNENSNNKKLTTEIAQLKKQVQELQEELAQLKKYVGGNQ